MDKKEFERQCNERGLSISSSSLDKLHRYFELLVKYNEVMNLTSIIEEEEVYEKHFFDCLLFSFDYNLNNKIGIDVGSGAGFPGMVLAIVYPSLKMHLLEPLNKRCNFLNAVKEELGLTNVTVINDRAEVYSSLNQEKYDFATARAVAKLNILLEISAPMIKIDGYFIALKGKIGDEEIKEANNALKVLDFKIDKIQREHLPSNNDERVNVFIKKCKKTNGKYPRNYGQIKKHPL